MPQKGLGGRFEGDKGQQLLIGELEKQRLLAGLTGAATAVCEGGELLDLPPGAEIITQGDPTSEIYFIVDGTFGVFVNSKRVATRGSGGTVGEMAASSPVQRRSASVISDENALVVKVDASQFLEIADRFPSIWKKLSQELATRLTQRNALVRQPNEKPRVFVISSAEALPVARAIENAFAFDPFITVVWANGVFRVTNYTLETLERELDRSDFAVAVAHADDVVLSRGEDWPSPRDNVIFELGYFMGRLGRERAILMEPRAQKLKLPSDLAGITTIKYRSDPKQELSTLLGPACNELRDHIARLGRNL